MVNRSKAMLFSAVLAAVILAPACTGPVPPSERSVIVITLDTTRADHLGAYGEAPVSTPVLDKVAQEGVVFESAYSHVPLTLPAHASIFTGMYPASHGVRHNGIYRLPNEVLTLAEKLGSEGFETAAFIAAFILNRGFGLEQGFEEYNDVPAGRQAAGQDHQFIAERKAEQINQLVFDWLDREHSERVFLWVHYYDPHEPYMPPEDVEGLEGEGYAREISYLDLQVGQLMARLDRDGWLDRSIVVVAGDHGESLGEHGELSHGVFLYEGAIHVPLFISARGLIPARQRVSSPVGLVDITPTILDLLGLEQLPGTEGESLLPRISELDRKGADPRELVFAETLMPRLEFGWSELFMATDGRYKYIEAPKPELYDLKDDPDEENNLVSDRTDLGDRFRSGLAAWHEATGGSGLADAASREIDAEELEKLRMLGYLEEVAEKNTGGPDKPLPDPKDMMQEIERLDLARVALYEGRTEEAVRIVSEMVEDNPLNHWAQITLVRALNKLGKAQEAEEAARTYLKLGADGSVSMENMEHMMLVQAEAHIAQGEREEAEKIYRAVRGNNPRGVLAAVKLAHLMLDSDRAEEGLKVIDRVLEDDPGSGVCLAARFDCLMALDRRQEALEAARELARVRAGSPSSLVKAGDLLMQSGQPGPAAACYEGAQEQIDPEPVLLGKIGVANMNAGLPAKAARVFLVLTELAPEDPRPPLYLGELALARGEETEARKWFDICLARSPRFSAPRISYARWLAANGRVEEAQSVLLDAIKTNPGDTKVKDMIRELANTP